METTLKAMGMVPYLTWIELNVNFNKLVEFPDFGAQPET